MTEEKLLVWDDEQAVCSFCAAANAGTVCFRHPNNPTGPLICTACIAQSIYMLHLMIEEAAGDLEPDNETASTQTIPADPPNS